MNLSKSVGSFVKWRQCKFTLSVMGTNICYLMEKNIGELNNPLL